MNCKQKQIIFCFVAIMTFAVGAIVVWNFQQQNQPTASRFLVQIPPKPRPISDLKSVPYVCGDLIVRLETNSSLSLNNQKKVGHLSEASNLTIRLREIFDERIEMGVYDPRFSNLEKLTDEERIYKRVVIAAPLSANYIDVVRIVDAVKNSGTNDIWLQIDGDDYTWLTFESVEPSR